MAHFLTSVDSEHTLKITTKIKAGLQRYFCLLFFCRQTETRNKHSR